MPDEPEKPEETPSPEDSTPPPPPAPEDTPPPPPPTEAMPSTPPPASGGATPPPPPAYGTVAPGQGKLSDKDDKMFGMLAHLLGLVSFIGPLVIWLVKKEESPFVDDQGKEALNFQLTLLIGYVSCSIISMIPFIGCIAMVAIFAIMIVQIVFLIIGSMKANEGIAYRYPFNIRMIN